MLRTRKAFNIQKMEVKRTTSYLVTEKLTQRVFWEKEKNKGYTQQHLYAIPFGILRIAKTLACIKNMNRLILILSFTIGLISCDSTIPFEKANWEKHVDAFYPYRNSMINDLLGTNDFNGKSLKEVFEVLGKHDDWCDHNMHELKYQVLVDYGSDIDPVHTKYLVFELNPMDSLIDSNTVIVNYRIDEWKK